MSKTGAERLIESLIAAGVKHLFSLSGNQILSIYDASVGRDIAISSIHATKQQRCTWQMGGDV